MNKCQFCNKELIKKEEIMRNETCIFLSSEKYNPEGVLVGAGVIISIAHKETPFELSKQEISDMFDLLKSAKSYIDKKYKPDGYTLGWNVGKVSGQITPFHVHLHLMPRYNDEPLAGKGIRHYLKQPNNKRKSYQLGEK